MKWLVVGISGASCSGKTSVAEKLHESFKNSILVQQDKYFLLQDDPRHTLVQELNHFNWEILSSLDMEKMYSDIKDIIDPQTPNQTDNTDDEIRILFIEGFLIYNYELINKLCDVKFFIEITKDICWERRKKRVYDPPDVPGYFDKVVWPEYLKHKLELMMNINCYKMIFFLDGNQSINHLHNEIETGIKMACNKINKMK